MGRPKKMTEIFYCILCTDLGNKRKMKKKKSIYFLKKPEMFFVKFALMNQIEYPAQQPLVYWPLHEFSSF